MEIEIRMWHMSQQKMYDSEQMVRDQLTLLTDGRFINVSGNSQLSSIIYPSNKLIPMLYIGKNDVNGTKIFECDILWCESESCKGDVWYEDAGFKTDCFCGDAVGLINGELVEVIGNVFENPELVEGLIRI